MTLASGGRDDTIKLWEMASGKLLRTLEGHSSSVEAVAFSPDGTTLVSGSYDTSLRFWRVRDGALLAVAYVIDKSDYIIYSRQGYFAASKNAERFAAWRIGNEVYTFEQYSEQFNRPDLIARILAGEEVPRPTIRLAVDLPPQLVWTNLISSTSTQEVEIVLRYKGTSGLADLVCLHNDKSIEIKLPTGSREAEIRIPLRLTAYDNSLRILAIDEKRLKSDLRLINFQYESGQKGGGGVRETVERKPQLGTYGKKYAIVIGISDYKYLQETAANENELVDLQFAHKDAQDFVAFLQDSTNYEIEDNMGRRGGKLGETVFSGDKIYLSFEASHACWLSVFGVDTKGIHPVFREKLSPSLVEKEIKYTLDFDLDETVGNEVYYAVAAHEDFSFEKDIQPHLRRVFPQGHTKGPKFSEYELSLPQEFTQKLIYFHHDSLRHYLRNY